NQRLRNATEPKVIQKLDLLVKYYSELNNIIEFLNEYIVYEKYYNQIIRNDNFIEKLQKILNFATSINDNYDDINQQLENITNKLNESE
ncbi:16671_t:CDS:1, partial [Racocetra fulgida]